MHNIGPNASGCENIEQTFSFQQKGNIILVLSRFFFLNFPGLSTMNFILFMGATGILSRFVATFNRNQLEFAANRFYEEMNSILISQTRADVLEAEYNRFYNDKIIEIKKISLPEVSKQFAENLNQLLERKKKSLMNIKRKAAELYNNYNSNENIKPFDYSNWQNNNSVTEERLFHIGKRVNLNKSHVHIPANIYENHPDILNTAKWSTELDDVFRRNYNDQPDLLWQYFGSKTGLFRLYPGIR